MRDSSMQADRALDVEGIHLLFEQCALSNPESVALICVERQMTYGELNRRANELARTLLAAGVRPDERVGLFVERGLEMVIGLLAILKAGGAYVPLDPSQPLERVQYLLDDSEPLLVLTAKPLSGRLPAIDVRVVIIDCSEPEAHDGSESNLEATELGLTRHSLAYVIYTSGSTGAPKGVMIEHHSVVNLVRWHCAAFGIDTGCRCSCVAAMGFDAASWEILCPLSAGATLVLAPGRIGDDPEEFCRWWLQQSLDISFLPTPIAEVILARNIANPRLRVLLVGGDRLHRGPFSDATFSVVNNYGPTETTVLSTSGRIESADTTMHIGRPIANTQIHILDEQLAAVGRGMPGEIYIGGSGIARGYLKRPGLTADRFLTDRFSIEPAARMYRTGDLGRWLEDGRIEFIGRNDQQVKIRGFRIELGEIESQLIEHECVSAAAAVVRVDEFDQKRLIAYVVADLLRAKGSGDARQFIGELREQLSRRLPACMIPAAIVLIDSLPLTPNGKVDRSALENRDSQALSIEQYAAPEGELERTLAGVWQELLHVERISRDANFFELGGDSLLGMKLMARVSQVLSVEPVGASVFRHPTLRELARYLERSPELAADQPLTPRLIGSTAPLTFSQQSWWQLAELGKRGGARSVFAAARITGYLNCELLEKSLADLVVRHESLRTNVVVAGGVPSLIVRAAAEFILEVVNLAGSSQGQPEVEAACLVRQLVTERVDVESERLFAAKLLRLGDADHVLAVAMEHSISDGASVGILLRDLWTTYMRHVRGMPVVLPAMPIQFPDYALWQRRIQLSWLERHDAYWRERLAGAERVNVFGGQAVRTVGKPGFVAMETRFGLPLSSALRELGRREGTTLAMAVLAVYAALLMRWCEVTEIVVPFETMGRRHPEVENTVGYFGSTLFLRVALRPTDSFLELLQRVTREYAIASEHDDYGQIEARVPRPAFADNPSFNWFPREFNVCLPNFTAFVDGSSFEGMSEIMTVKPFTMSLPEGLGGDEGNGIEWFSEPRLLLSDSDTGISGLLWYRSDRATPVEAARFERTLRRLADILSSNPERRLLEVHCSE